MNNKSFWIIIFFIHLQKTNYMAHNNTNHPALVSFRKLIIEDRYKMMRETGRKVNSTEHGKKFQFLSNPYFNNIENGKVTPSFDTFLDMLDIMGYEIQYVEKPAQNNSSIPITDKNSEV